jgi:hypothetical protein
VSPIDDIYRMTGYYHVPNVPLIAVTGISMQAALDRLWWRLIGLALLGLPLILALDHAISAWIVVLLRRDEQTRRELSQALRQNEMLLREVHHRVKNNLQIVASLIRLQPGPPEAKIEMARRIAAMSAVHEQLYLSDQIGRIDVGDYLRKLVDNLAETYGRRPPSNTISTHRRRDRAGFAARSGGQRDHVERLQARLSGRPRGAPHRRAEAARRRSRAAAHLRQRSRLRPGAAGRRAGPAAPAGLLPAAQRHLQLHIEHGTTLELTFPLVRPTESAAKEMAAAA